jgi:AcrR family transcriptional regulator
MRKLAQELGTGAASLYWHVGDKEELLGLLLDRIVGEAEVPEPDPEHWQDQVRAMARAARRLFKRRRDAAQLSMGRIPAGPNSLPVMERNLAVLAAAALPPRLIGYAADLFALYVGAFAYEESLARNSAADAAQFREYLRSLPPEEFPVMTRLADDLTEGDADARFEFGVEVLIAGIEALAERRGQQDG